MRPTVFFTLLILLAGIFSFSPAGNFGTAEDVLTYTNAFRKSKGLNDLQSNSALDAIARKHSENMASGKVKFGHDGFAKRNQQAKQDVPGLRYFAENVAFGVPTGEAAVNLWKNSEGHRKNMLGKFAKIGIGVAKDKNGRIFYTQVFSD